MYKIIHLCDFSKHSAGVACKQNMNDCMYDGFTFYIKEVNCEQCLRSEKAREYFVKRLVGEQ